MVKNLKDFIKQSNNKIKKENLKISNLQREVGQYEAIIEVVSQTGSSNEIGFYKAKIDKCQQKIDRALENIRHSRDIIIVMKQVDKIIKRGEKSA